jgi:hypothetical protein
MRSSRRSARRPGRAAGNLHPRDGGGWSAGYYYQVWLGNRAGILVPVGTFNDARQVSLWSGVPVTRYRTLTVTVQQVGGEPSLVRPRRPDRHHQAARLTATESTAPI